MSDIEKEVLNGLVDDLGLVESDKMTDSEKFDLENLNSVDWINNQFSLDKIIVVERFRKVDDAVLGRLYFRGVLLCYTLEKFSKIIDHGEYSLKITHSPRFGKFTPEIIVKGRSGLRIHIGNSLRDTNGCVLCGYSYGDITLRNSTICFDNLMYNIRNCGACLIRFFNNF